MKTLKRIIFALLGLLIAGTVALVGIILYAEYSGNRFTPDSVPAQAEADLYEEESRLAYDDNGNLIELPTAQAPEEAADTPAEGSAAGAESEAVSDMPADNTAQTANAAADNASQAAAQAPETPAPDANSAYAASGAGSEPELPYVMDLGTALFHTPGCPNAANIDADKRSEMTTTSIKIINAGYKPCPNCHPDTAAASSAAADAGSATVTVSNELNY